MVYLTFAGNHEKISDGDQEPGALFTIFNEYKTRNDHMHVLLLGERATSKQVVAEAIWRLSQRLKARD